MNKLITIPDDIKIKLQVKAAKADKSLKRYIQDLLIEHAKK